MKLRENRLALFLCIHKEISIDKALIKMGIRKHCNSAKNKYNQSEINCIKKLKDKGKSYTEIGVMFGMTRGQVAGIIRTNRLKATRTPTKVVQMA